MGHLVETDGLAEVNTDAFLTFTTLGSNDHSTVQAS